MIRVPAGAFWEGLDEAELDGVVALCSEFAGAPCDRERLIEHHRNETPRRWVHLEAFAIDRTEVTNRAYAACVDAGGCAAIDLAACTFFRDGARALGGQLDDARRAADAPVVCVSWQQAAAYCAWTGKRLPSEAEWEKAARGDDGRRFPWGERWLPNAANWADGGPGAADGGSDGYATTAPVGRFPAGASPYGALDMAGNVWEWVADVYRADRGPGPPADVAEVSAEATRVMRGGGYAAKPIAMRTTKRVPRAPGGYENVGVRCAR